MAFWEMDESRAKLNKLSEQIFEYKEKKKELELELSEEKHRYHYILKRRNLLANKVIASFCAMIPFILYIIIFGNNLFAIFADALCLIIILSLFIRAMRVLVRLVMSSNISFVSKYAKEHNWKTLQEEERISKDKMKWLNQQMEEIEEKIVSLSNQREQVQKDQEYEKPVVKQESTHNDKFLLKENAYFAQDKNDLFEFYSKEEHYYNEYLTTLEGKLSDCNREIVEIDDNFNNIKSKILISFIIFLLMIISQGIFEGWLATLFAVSCFILGLLFIFYVEFYCKRPILLYLIEHESDLTKEYAFKNNYAPVANKRVQLLEEIEECKKELAEVKRQKDAL